MDKTTTITLGELSKNLRYLRMNFLAANLDPLISQLALKELSNLEFPEELIKAEVNEKEQRAQQRRINNARIGIIKTLEDFKFHHPSKIDEEKVRYHNRLGFIERRQNIIIIGTVGLGKTHIAKSYLHQAALAGYNCLFVTAAQITEQLSTAQKNQILEKAIKKYIKPQCLLIDELGFIPMRVNKPVIFSFRSSAGGMRIAQQSLPVTEPIINGDRFLITTLLLQVQF